MHGRGIKMSDFIFKISQNIVLGTYTINRLAHYIKNFGDKFMVILDPVLKEVGVESKVLQPLLERKIEYFIYDNITDSANSKEIEQALSLAQNGHAHGIIAVGGAKAMLMGAAVAALANEKRSIYDYFEGSVPTAASIPLICVPTTSRAPFIFGNSLPLVDSRSHQLKIVNTQEGVCKLVLWDPNLTVTLTENQKSSIAIETLCLAVESFLSQKASFFSDMLSEKSVELMKLAMDGSKSLEVTTPEETLLSQAGSLASIAAATSSVGIAILLSTTLNARYKISKALVASILFPYVIEDAKKYKAERLKRIAVKMGASDENHSAEEAAQAFADNIRQRLAKANLPTRLKELSLTVDQLALVAEDAGQLDIMNGLPRSMTTDDLFDILKSAY